VLTEYLTFSCTAPENLRRQVAKNVQAILQDPGVRDIPQSRDSFLAGLELYAARPDKRLQPHRLHFHGDHAA
jgi:hypothetical protein